MESRETDPESTATADESTPDSSKRPTRRDLLLMLATTSVAAVLIGLVAVLFEWLEGLGVRSMAFLAGTPSPGVPEAEALIQGPWRTILPALAVFTAMPLIIWLQRRFFPGTEGTGIPQAIAAIRIGASPARALMLSLRIAVGKILLLAIALVSGVTVGREGPSVHVGACCMHLCTLVCRVPSWLLERGLILAGGAAGIAAAFNTPIAGAIFCIEEIARSFDRRNMPAIIRTVAIACIVGVVLLGDYRFYGDDNRGTALPLAWADGQTFGDWVRSLRGWLVVPVIGLVGGALGGVFARGVVEASRRVGDVLVSAPIRTGLVFGGMLALIGILSGGDSYGGGHAETLKMLEAAADSERPIVGWSHPLGTAAASFVALVSGIPGGLFDPSLTVGAGLGQVTHEWFRAVLGPEPDLPALMMLWMAGYFAGVVRSPLTVAAIMTEMTGAYGMVLPLMLVAMIASMVAGRFCEPSIYDALAGRFLERLGLAERDSTGQSRSR